MLVVGIDLAIIVILRIGDVKNECAKSKAGASEQKSGPWLGFH